MIVLFLSLGFGLEMLGLIPLILLMLIPNDPNCGSSCYNNSPWGIIIGQLIVLLIQVGFGLGVTAWIGALVKQGQQQQWRWFIATMISGLAVPILFLFGFFNLFLNWDLFSFSGPLLCSICLLVYLIRVPETPQYAVVKYAPNYQPIVEYQPIPAEQPVQEEPPQE